MNKIFMIILPFSILLTGCISQEQEEIIKENRLKLGEVEINYYADKSVTSLEIPPDLTDPKYQSAFRISDYVKGVNKKTVNLTNNNFDYESQKVRAIPAEIIVKKYGNRRWLEVDKNTEIVWELSQQFLKDNGFTLKKINKKTGIMETDFLENKPKIPQKNLGIFRSFLESSVENVSYTLPRVDSYIVRIEPLDNGEKAEVHMTLNSMAERVTGSGTNESTLWQSTEKDVNLENEMLYSLMIYLGGDEAQAREKIINAKDHKQLVVTLGESLNNFAKLSFNTNIIETWDLLSWAFTNLSFNLEDKDFKEKTFYLNMARSSDLGLMSKIFGDDAIRKNYQIQLREVEKNKTEVFFNDLSEQNEKETKEFSFEIFKKIKDLF